VNDAGSNSVIVSPSLTAARTVQPVRERTSASTTVRSASRPGELHDIDLSVDGQYLLVFEDGGGQQFGR